MRNPHLSEAALETLLASVARAAKTFEVFDRLVRSDVKCRFVIDMATLR
jgi:hypothetical protein